MGTTLEKAFDLRSIKEAMVAQTDIDKIDVEKEAKKNAVTPEEAMQHAAEIVIALSAAEKVDYALTTVAGLSDHDEDMDEISKEALESYMELKELGMNMSDSHSGRIMEVAATMLKTALEARDAKVNRKLRTIDLQLRKIKIDAILNNDKGGASDGLSFDRNTLLQSLKELRKDKDD